jgi:ferredoxin-NADP reductase
MAVSSESASCGGCAYLCDKVTEGTLLRIRGPRNHLALVDSDEYRFIAGGIGITQVSSMVASVDRAGRSLT